MKHRAHLAFALCAATSSDYAAVCLGALRAGVVVAPLAPGSTPEAFARMLADAGARRLIARAAGDAAAGRTGQEKFSTARERATPAPPARQVRQRSDHCLRKTLTGAPGPGSSASQL